MFFVGLSILNYSREFTHIYKMIFDSKVYIVGISKKLGGINLNLFSTCLKLIFFNDPLILKVDILIHIKIILNFSLTIFSVTRNI